MTLRCPKCEAEYENTRELDQLCNICHQPAERKTSQLFRPTPKQTVLVCVDCLPKLQDKTLTELLAETEGACHGEGV